MKKKSQQKSKASTLRLPADLMKRFQHAVTERDMQQKQALEEAVQLWISAALPARGGRSSLGSLTEEEARLCGVVLRWLRDSSKPARVVVRWLDGLEEIMGAESRVSRDAEAKAGDPEPGAGGIQ